MSKLSINEMLEKLHENEVVELTEDEEEQEQENQEEEQENQEDKYNIEKYFNDIEEEDNEKVYEEPKPNLKLLSALESETDDEEENINIEKPKRIKNKSQFKKYKNDKKVIQDIIKLVKKLMREYKLNIRKYLKSYSNMELEEEDKEDIIDEHNLLKQNFLNDIYTLEDQATQNDVNIPTDLYKMVEKMFDTEKNRVIKVIS